MAPKPNERLRLAEILDTPAAELFPPADSRLIAAARHVVATATAKGGSVADVRRAVWLLSEALAEHDGTQPT